MPRLHATPGNPREIPESAPHLRAWVIYQLGLRGTNLAALAREQGVDRTCMYHAFVAPYPRMERIIARALGLEPQQLWPDRYGPDGRSNRKRGRPSSSGKSTISHNTRADRARNINQRRAS